MFAAAGYRTITYDRRGFCRSDEPRSDTVTTASPRT
ncbi:alpha/beta fold hydrolase [Microbacterium nanhaiense]